MNSRPGVSLIVADSIEEYNRLAEIFGVEYGHRVEDMLDHLDIKEPVFYFITDDISKAHNLVRVLNPNRSVISIGCMRKPLIKNWDLKWIQHTLNHSEASNHPDEVEKDDPWASLGYALGYARR